MARSMIAYILYKMNNKMAVLNKNDMFSSFIKETDADIVSTTNVIRPNTVSPMSSQAISPKLFEIRRHDWPAILIVTVNLTIQI